MLNKRPYALSIAGFDPSGGAGLTADTKTFETLKVQGLSVCTAITYQHESEFDGLEWLSVQQIKRQLEVLFRQYIVEVVKIGLIQSMGVLEEVISFLKQYNPAMKIVWDPILKASSGFTFHEQVNKSHLENLCQHLLLITPNWLEMEQLAPEFSATEGANALSQYCDVLLKGGHNDFNKGNDYLYTQGQLQVFKPSLLQVYEKHGSGCVLSTAIAALLAHEYKLPEACLIAKKYTTRFLGSNPG